MDHEGVPRHIGIIPDGNRRWAQGQGLAVMEGHRRGVGVAKKVCVAAFERGVKFVTFYAFSTENWGRPADEVKYLGELFYRVVTRELDELYEKGVRLRVIGRTSGFGKRLREALSQAEERTKNNTRGTLCLCLNYGGEQEIADAAAALVREGVRADEVTPAVVRERLYAPEVPEVDLVIRTSGERRTSGFMMWRAAYAELYFTPVLWPDFGAEGLNAALDDYAERQRRFGR